MKNENKELESQVHKRLDEIQKLEDRIDELEDGNLLSKLQDKNKQLEEELAETLEKLKLHKHPITEKANKHQDRESGDTSSESSSHVALASDEERESNDFVIKEMAVQLSELLLKAEQEKDGSAQVIMSMASPPCGKY